jgi:hypothetical protein
VTDDRPQPREATEEQQDSREHQPQPPLLRIVKGDATPEEVAALVAVIASLGSGAGLAKRRTPEWSAHHRKTRVSLPHGPGGWRSSSLPRG